MGKKDVREDNRMRIGKILVRDDNKRSLFDFEITKEADIDRASDIMKKKFFGDR